MDSLRGVLASPILWAVVIALVVIAIVWRRSQRSQRLRPAVRPLPADDRPVPGEEAQNLDSSHIGGPIFPDELDPLKGGAKARAQGGQPAGARK